MRQTINHLDQRIQLERARDRTGDDLDRARVRLIPLSGERAQARQASKQFRSALSEVYRDPVAARRAFHTQAERTGAAAAAAELGRHPQRFGELRGTQLGPVRSAERAAALQAAPKLEHLGSEYVGRVREAWSNRAEYRQARATVVHLERQIRGLDSELGRSPGRAQLEQRLAQQVRALQPRQRQSLQRLLSKPQMALVRTTVVGKTMMLAREFAREQGRER